MQLLTCRSVLQQLMLQALRIHTEKKIPGKKMITKVVQPQKLSPSSRYSMPALMSVPMSKRVGRALLIRVIAKCFRTSNQVRSCHIFFTVSSR